MPSVTTLITGGAGFIGSHLADALLARGETVVCVDNFDSYYDPARKRANVAAQLAHPHYVLAEADICDGDAMSAVFQQHRPQRVAHLAALAGVRASIEQAARYAEVNLIGSVRVLDAARAVGVQNFVQASTSSVYGDTTDIPFHEDQPTDQPLAPYPASKKAAEVMAHAYHNMFRVPITVLRFFTVYGPRVRPDMMAYMVMDRIVRSQEITVFDNRELRRDWTYVDDIIQGVVAALDRPAGFEVMNIGRGEPVRLADFIDIIQGLVGQPARLKIVPTPASEPPVTYASVEKAARLLGYKPATSIREGLARTWEWYQQSHNL